MPFRAQQNALAVDTAMAFMGPLAGRLRLGAALAQTPHGVTNTADEQQRSPAVERDGGRASGGRAAVGWRLGLGFGSQQQGRNKEKIFKHDVLTKDKQ